MSYTLIITEKPTAAKTLAKALAEGEVKEFDNNGVKYYEISREGKKFVVAPAAGHLFMLKQKSKGWDYPRFDVDWVPSYTFKVSKFSEKFFKNIEALAKGASDFIIATDYDEEGEVIGANILKFICKRDNAKRMKFSTMTKEELLESFENISPTLNKNLVEAGYTRHMLDWYFGINFTRALTNAMKSVGKRFRIVSTGRVQGPTLAILAKHEKKIREFKPKTFWEIKLEVKVGKEKFIADFEKDKIWNKEEAEKIINSLKDAKKAKIEDIKKRTIIQKPPKPYNTTSLLADINRYFGYTAMQAMQIAEALYQAGYISYPRTSSEKLPEDINYRRILQNLGNISKYKKLSEILLEKKELKPNEGSKTDPAHPAIYPTHEVPKKLGDRQQKVYDLIVHRFLATFGDPAKREGIKILLNVNGMKFSLSGVKTISPGWLLLYGPYGKREDVELPEIEKGEEISIVKVIKLEKQTQPPARYSQGSILKEMETRGLGTKATRAIILQILYNRGYLVGKSIEVTDFGLKLVEILEKNIKEIVSEELTRKFEEECDLVESGKKKREEVLEEAKRKIIEISEKIKKIENKIGEELTKALIESQDKYSTLGTCPKCGGTLKIFKMWNTGKRFVGCSNYKKGCSLAFPLPKDGTIVATGKICEDCKTPIIQVSREGSRPFRMCLDPNCISKKDWVNNKINSNNSDANNENSRRNIKNTK
ncbi:MAG: DNA topoisomerase I [Candidatus Aenigmatarchaeota archaeon]